MIDVKEAYKIAKDFALKEEDVKFLTCCKEFPEKYIFTFVIALDKDITDDGTNIEVYKANGQVGYYEFLNPMNMKIYAKAPKIKLSTFK